MFDIKAAVRKLFSAHTVKLPVRDQFDRLCGKRASNLTGEEVAGVGFALKP